MQAFDNDEEFNLLCKVLVEDSLWLDSFGWHVMPGCSEKSVLNSKCRVGLSQEKPTDSLPNSRKHTQEFGVNAESATSNKPTTGAMANKTYGLLKRASCLEPIVENKDTCVQGVKKQKTSGSSESEPEETTRISIASLLN